VIGIDMTPETVAKAQATAEALGLATSSSAKRSPPPQNRHAITGRSA
jgi:hypothetical protein